MRLAKIMLVGITLTIAYSGCSIFPGNPNPKAAEAKQVNTRNPDFVLPQTNHGRLIVFVHGIFGDAYDTWKSREGTYFWELMKGDPLFQRSDVFAYGFPSRFWSSSFTIDDAANDIDTHLRRFLEQYREVIFVAHSMGGLVVERYLLRNRAIARKVPLVFFYSTPQEGAQIARIADYVASNPGLVTMLPGSTNQYLVSLDMDWRAAKYQRDIPTVIFCAYETAKTFNVRIVDFNSGTRLCEGPSSPIDADHIDIVKPSSRKHSSYLAFANAFEEIVVKPRQAALMKADQLSAREYQGTFSLKLTGDEGGYLGSDFTLAKERTIWDAKPGFHQYNNDPKSRVEGYNIFFPNRYSAWQAVKTNGPLSIWNLSGAPGSRPEDWELFVFERISDSVAPVVKVKNAVGGYVRYDPGQSRFTSDAMPTQASIFYVE